jgi:hypothetical protein
MSDTDGFDVDVTGLRDFAATLDGLAEEAQDIARVLAGVTAETGRADSDQMGVLAPGDLGTALRRLHEAVVTDSRNIIRAAGNYAESDVRVAGAMSAIQRVA